LAGGDTDRRGFVLASDKLDASETVGAAGIGALKMVPLSDDSAQ
jgi:hypothetical protein